MSQRNANQRPSSIIVERVSLFMMSFAKAPLALVHKKLVISHGLIQEMNEMATHAPTKSLQLYNFQSELLPDSITEKRTFKIFLGHSLRSPS